MTDRTGLIILGLTATIMLTSAGVIVYEFLKLVALLKYVAS
jgi:hypothetical protein